MGNIADINLIPNIILRSISPLPSSSGSVSRNFPSHPKANLSLIAYEAVLDMHLSKPLFLAFAAVATAQDISSIVSSALSVASSVVSEGASVASSAVSEGTSVAGSAASAAGSAASSAVSMASSIVSAYSPVCHLWCLLPCLRLLPSHHRPNHWLRALPPAPRLRLHLYEAASVAGSAASCPVPVLLSPAP